MVYVNLQSGATRAAPPDLSHESATHIQRMMRGRLGRARALKLRELEMKKTCVLRRHRCLACVACFGVLTLNAAVAQTGPTVAGGGASIR